MSLSDLETLGKRVISSERYVQEESTRKLELEGVVVPIRQGSPFEKVVVTFQSPQSP